MQEVLASIPGFNLKHRKKTARKLSAAAQLEQTKEGLIDLETPDSIFAVLNLSKLLTQETLAQLPLLYQQKLLQLLPEVDRPSSFTGFKYVPKLS
jgi:additional sex combs-like protein